MKRNSFPCERDSSCENRVRLSNQDVCLANQISRGTLEKGWRSALGERGSTRRAPQVKVTCVDKDWEWWYVMPRYGSI